MYINETDKSILDIINKFGCIDICQLEKIVELKSRKIEKSIKVLLFNKLIKREDNYLLSKSSKAIDHKILKCIDLYIHFKKHVDWYIRTDFPYTLTMFMHGSTYDLTVINPGEEAIVSSAIERSNIEKSIIIVDTIDIINKININNKLIRYCTLNPVQFYSKDNGIIKKS